MKIVSALILALALAFNSRTAFAQPKMFPGVVVKVDQPAKKITIKHGPIPQLDMNEPITIVYAASDPTMLTGLKAGDKVNFEAEQVNGQYTVKKIEKAR
jgi:Cu(I)/Ag(I) efflux system periplasmic protein CusF